MKTNNKKTKISMDEEMMMWCAYRYAIGRHTYVNTLANHIAKTYYDKLSDERLEFTAKDIRSCVTDVLRFGRMNFGYDGTVSYDERVGISDLMPWINENINDEKDWIGISSITIYKESYKSDAPKLFRISKENPSINLPYYEHEISDLLIWEDLASCFDKKNHKIAHVKFNGEEKDVEVFESWVPKYVEIPDQPGYCKAVPWKWKKVYKSVDEFIKRGEYAGYIFEDYIVNVD